jgi:hypothetical protein
MNEPQDLWHVQLESGEVRQLTLDQLDAFFQNGIIDEDTYILQDGEMDWRKLRDVLGLDDEPAAPEAPAPAPVYVAPAPAPAAATLVGVAPPPNPFAPAPLPADLTTPTPAAVSYGAVPSYRPQPYSIRPVVSEIDAEELSMDEAVFRKSNKPKYFVAGGIVAAVGLMLAFVVASRAGSSSHAVDLTANVAAAAPTTPPQPSVTIPPPPPVETQAPAAPKLNDDAKKALAAKDNQFAQKLDQRRQAKAAKNVAASTHKSSAPFSKSGNAYDPLNAKL